jgi:acetyl-CoA acyltransferase
MLAPMETRNVVIVDAVRSPIGRAKKGSLIHTRIDDLAVHVLKALLVRTKVDPASIEDVGVGCAFPEAEQGMNIARHVVLLADLPQSIAGHTTNRFCGSSMETVHSLARAIMVGDADVAISIGLEHMTHVPMGGFRPTDAFHPGLMERKALWPMPQTAQNLAEDYGIEREQMDRFAAQSHRRAAAATSSGRFKDEIVPIHVPVSDAEGKPTFEKKIFAEDECIRPDTTPEKLAALEPVKGMPPLFSMKDGPLLITAGNSSPLNDGAAALLLMEETRARKLGYEPLARIRSMAVAGVEPRIMGIGPVPASHKALARAGIEMKAVDLVELNEAFAGQVLACTRDLGIPEEKLNVNGGAVALGHPLGCSGTRLLVTLTHEMKKRGAKKGLATMCIGGGQGIATVVERD